MSNARFTPQPVGLAGAAMSYVPASIASADALYAVEPEHNGKVFISTHANPNGHVCTHVDARHVNYLD